MRSFFVLLTGLILTQAAVCKADVEDLDLDESEYSFSHDVVDAAPRWNRWTCIATRPLNLRLFRGQSYYFRDGSGEGQEARRVAQKIAVGACEHATNATCTSDLSRCTVESN